MRRQVQQLAVSSWQLAALSGRLLPTAYCLLFLLLGGCRVNYGFTGGEVGDARTVSVEVIEARAPLATPLSAQVLTETLRDLLLAPNAVEAEA